MSGGNTNGYNSYVGYTGNTSTANSTWTVYTSTATYQSGGTISSPVYVGAIGTGPLTSFEDPVEELRNRCEKLEEWYAGKLCEMIGKIEEQDYEVTDLKERIADLESTLKKLVDVLVKANE